jgi:NDP-glycosyltransferase
MARFALLTVPMAGHAGPALEVARELVARGHRVDAHLPPEWRPAVAAAGARHAPLAPPAPPARTSEDPLARCARIPLELTAHSRRVLGPLLARLRDDPPDLLLYDALCVWGRLAAEALPEPAAMLCTTYAMSPRFSYLTVAPDAGDPALADAIDGFAGDMHALARAHGVPRLGVAELFLHSEPLTLVLVPPELQPRREAFSARHRFVGPALCERGERLDAQLAALDPARTVYLSLGTVFDDWPAFATTTLAAFADGSWDVVLAGADAPRHAAPPGVRAVMRARVPQRALLARTRAFVTHGGMSSVMEAAVRGVPLVVVPQTPEQAITAEHVVRAGAGVRLERESLTPAALRGAVERVAREPAFRAGARELAALARKAGGAAAAATALVAHARRAPAPSPAALTPTGAAPTAGPR